MRAAGFLVARGSSRGVAVEVDGCREVAEVAKKLRAVAFSNWIFEYRPSLAAFVSSGVA